MNLTPNEQQAYEREQAKNFIADIREEIAYRIEQNEQYDTELELQLIAMEKRIKQLEHDSSCVPFLLNLFGINQLSAFICGSKSMDDTQIDSRETTTQPSHSKQD